MAKSIIRYFQAVDVSDNNGKRQLPGCIQTLQFFHYESTVVKPRKGIMITQVKDLFLLFPVLTYIPENHDYAENITLTVLDRSGAVGDRDRVFLSASLWLPDHPLFSQFLRFEAETHRGNP